MAEWKLMIWLSFATHGCFLSLFLSPDFLSAESEKPRWLAADRGFSSPVAAWVSAGPPSESGEGVYAWPDLWLK